MKKTSLAVLVAASLGFAGAAAASTADTELRRSVQVDSETVEFDAERASTAAGASMLFDRIRQTADEVCRIASHPVGYEIWVQHNCEARAVARAVRSVDIPALNQRYGKPDDRMLIAGF